MVNQARIQDFTQGDARFFKGKIRQRRNFLDCARAKKKVRIVINCVKFKLIFTSNIRSDTYVIIDFS